MWNNRILSGSKFLALGLVFFAFLAGASNQASAKESKVKLVSESELLEPITVQIEKIKPQPSIILVNKNLEVVAEFYGSWEVLKEQFNQTFENTSFLAAYKSQSIYMITPEVTKK